MPTTRKEYEKLLETENELTSIPYPIYTMIKLPKTSKTYNTKKTIKRTTSPILRKPKIPIILPEEDIKRKNALKKMLKNLGMPRKITEVVKREKRGIDVIEEEQNLEIDPFKNKHRLKKDLIGDGSG